MQQSIDWFSWLSKTGLESSLIYEYGMAFSRNELEEDDITYFNHALLQSMGINIAKHRLEILKLARKQKGPNGLRPISKLVMAMMKTKSTLASYIQTWVRQDDSALVVVRKSNSSRWEGNMLKTYKRFVTFKQSTPTLLLTNGYHKSNSVINFSSPLLTVVIKKRKVAGMMTIMQVLMKAAVIGSMVKEIKWDTMFQNLKPT